MVRTAKRKTWTCRVDNPAKISCTGSKRGKVFDAIPAKFWWKMEDGRNMKVPRGHAFPNVVLRCIIVIHI